MESSVKNRLRLLMILTLALVVMNVVATLSGFFTGHDTAERAGPVAGGHHQHAGVTS